MDSGNVNPGSFSAYSVEDGIIQQLQLNTDGARLIAPSMFPASKTDLSSSDSAGRITGFEAAINGAYPLAVPVLDLKSRVVYSVDMVRLEFFHDNQQKLIDCIDKNPIFATMDTFTSNRIGSYRFLWAFDYSDGKKGGFCIERDGKEVVDGTKGTVLKAGYGVVGKGGKANNKGFVEFNPNKCEVNGRRFLEHLFANGCIFVLKRYDIAIDYSIPRSHVRVMRDRRTYEFVLSSKGGATEYLGTRNAPGRVKVYDKAGEQGLETDLTRVELTCSGTWTLKDIKEHLPICNDFKKVNNNSYLLTIANIISDLLMDVDEDGNRTIRALECVPERYWALMPQATRYKVKKMLKDSEKIINYNDVCIMKCVERANSFVIN